MSKKEERPIMFCPGCLSGEHVVAYANRVQCKANNCQLASSIGLWNYLHLVSKSDVRKEKMEREEGIDETP